MKQRLTFAGKICALVVGCLLVCGGVRGQVDYWSVVGNTNPFNVASYNRASGAMCYSDFNGNLYMATQPYYQSPTMEMAVWNGLNWTSYQVPTSLFSGWWVDGINAICNDNHGNVFIGGAIDSGNYHPKNFVLKWDGTNWSLLGNSANYNDGDWVYSLCYDSIHDYLYMGDGLNSGQAVYKWDGSTWSQLGSFDNEQFYQPKVFMSSGNLYVTGEMSFSQQTEISQSNIFEWNGAAWAPLDNTGWLFNANYQFFTYVSCSGPGNKFYAVGTDTLTEASCVYEWNGTGWSILGIGSNALNINGLIYSILADNSGNVYVAGDFYDANGYYYVAKWNGSAWSELGMNNLALHANGHINSLAEDSNGNVYATGNFWISNNWVYVAEYAPFPPGRLFVFPDATPANCGNTGSITSAAYNGTLPYTYTWSNGATSANINSLSSGTYFVTVTDANGLIATGDVVVTSSCFSIISGTVFVDTAGNCTYNGQQAGVNNVTLTLSGDSQTLYATTDENGHYSFAVSDTGNYYLYEQVGNAATCGNFTLCGNPSQIIHVGVLGDTLSGNNFALKPDASSFDLYLHPGWTSADPGFEKDYWVYFANNSPVPFTGTATVAFKYDPNLTFISSDIPYTSYNAAADSFAWVINNFSNTGWNFIGRVRFNVPSTLPLGYQLHSQFWIYPDGGDCDTTNNYLQYYETVKGSHDPNYKEVSPAGYSTAVDSVLTYTIHYQNTGTDSTYFIIVKDTLSPYLNPATVRNLASSDRYSSFSISGTGILTWTFLPLSLPAASTDSMASNGFITFSVNRMTNAPLGAVVANKASVYFDYNSAVVTNTVTDTVVSTCTDTISQSGGLCSGDSIYFYGRWIHTPGSYDTLLVGNPCDTFVTIGIVVRDPLPPHDISATICANDSLLFAGTYLHASGTYSHIACDSSVMLQLTVLAIQQTSFNQNICAGASYNFNDSLLTLTGVYTATITGANGCDSVITLHLTVIPNPLQPYITQQGDTLISSDSTGNQWYLNDIMLVGDTGNLLVVIQPGSYNVEVTGPNGCQNSSGTYAYLLNAVHSLDADLNIVIYPNPNGGLFTIEFSDNTAKEVIVTDVLGQTVLPAKTVITKGEFDLSALAGGIYFLKIKDMQNNNRVVFKQVVIQH